MFGADDVLLLDSGTHALEVAIRLAMGVTRDPAIVALPAYTCYDVATAAVGAGVRIALYDVDPNTLAPDLDSLGRALAAGARAVVVSPLYGIPVDWDAVERCVAPHGARVIEDAAQGHGSSWQDRRVGGFGALSVLSFGRGKGWTGGCGGALLTRKGATLAGPVTAPFPLATPWPFAGLVAAKGQWALSRPHIFGFAAALPWLHLGETPYHEPDAPRTMPRAAADLLQRTRELAERESSVRRENGAVLLGRITGDAIAAAGRVRPIRVPADGAAGYLRFPLRLARGLAGASDVRTARRLGLARGYPTSLAALEAVRERMTPLAPGARWSGADEIVRQLVTLPTHSFVTPRDRDALLRLIGVA
jgi:dTDP-4-amino-4,6-dideoxygalactose transaminase